MSRHYCHKCYMAGDYPYHSQPKWLHALTGRYAILRPIYNWLIKGEQK